jgi:streptogramin lyase
MAQQAFQNALTLERRVQASIFNLFNTRVGGDATPPPPLPSVVQTLSTTSANPTSNETSTLTPVDVSGFYMVTSSTEVTFYATTDVPIEPVSAGWSGIGFMGLIGQIQVTSVDMTNGPGYNWSFTLQTDTDQTVDGVQQATGATLYPPGQVMYLTSLGQSSLYGYYTITNHVVTFYFTSPPPPETSVGWMVSGLPTFRSPLKMTTYAQNEATLVPTDGSVPADTTVPIHVTGVPAMIQEPSFTTSFTPGKFTTKRLDIPDVQVQINSNLRTGNYAPQRDLNTDVAWSQEVQGGLFPESPYTEVKNKGFSSGSILALHATGPQDEHLLSDDMSRSEWNPDFKRYSNFVMYQKVYPFPPPNPSYQGSVVQIELRPTELGHLLSNMYLGVTLPALSGGSNYTPNVGRALLKQVDLLVNETIVETLYDDWYVIRDQLFLDADENLGLQNAINAQSATPTTYMGTGGDSTTFANGTVTHTFVQSNTFTINYGTYVNIVVVGGGGAGDPSGNGGGGGGAIQQTTFLPPGIYTVTVGSGGTQISSNGASSSFNGVYNASGGLGGAFGGTSGTGFISNTVYSYLSNVVYSSGGGAGASANVTTGTGPLAFTTALTLGSGGEGIAVNDAFSGQIAYYGGGGGGAADTTIDRTLATPGGLGGGGIGSVNVNGVLTPTLSPIALISGLSVPLGIAVDAGSNVFVADSGNNIIRKIDPSGTNITNLGVGEFYAPRGVAVDSFSNVYVSDTGNDAVKKINSTTGVVTTYTPPSCGFISPSGIAIDAQSNVYVVSPLLGNVFKINSTTLAVSNLARPVNGWYGLNGIAVDPQGNVYITNTTNVSVINSTTSALSNIASPPGGWSNVIGLAIQSNVYISDTYGSNIWSYNVASSSYTLVATQPDILYPVGVAVDSISNVYISSTGSNQIIQIVQIAQGSPTRFSTLAAVAFNNPQAAVSDIYGSVYVASTYENSVKKVLPNGTILNLAYGNFNAPQDLNIDAYGRIYVADTNNNAVKRMNSDGSNVVTLGYGFASPQGVAVDSLGNVYVGDTGNQEVKVILTNGTVQTLANPGWIAPAGVAVDSAGNVFVADAGLVGVFEIIASSSTVVPLAAPSGGWLIPYSVSLDPLGNIYVADGGYTGIFQISGSTVTEFAQGAFSGPFGIFVESTGNILVSDTGHNAVTRINNGATSGGFGVGGGGGGSVGTPPGDGGSGTVIVTYAAPQNVVPQSTLVIPLEFFFCRRYSHNNKDSERLRKPYFPVCAMWNQRLYVRFTFNQNTWWCNAPLENRTDLYPPNTTLWPQLITEEILLENAEKLYYQHTPLKYIVNRVQKESTLTFSSGDPILQLTASYPVQLLTWFFRNKTFETVTDGRYYASRYSYGYTTQYIQTGVQLQFPSGNANFVDVLNTAKITLNNTDILSTFQGSLYYSFKQPMEHSLSVPSKSIYLYSFGLTPKEYNQGGYLNFSKLNSQTTYLQLVFNPSYTNQLLQGYNLYMFYYGYSLLQFQGGFASLPFL